MSLYREIVNVWPGLGVGTSNQAGVRAALPVIGRPHAATGQAINWLMGRGHTLAVCGPALLQAWVPADYSFWIWPDDLHKDYTWWVSLSARDGLFKPLSLSGTIEINYIGAGGAQLFPFTTSADGSAVSVQMRQIAPTASNTPLEISCTITADVETPEFEATLLEVPFLVVHGIHIQESSQVLLDGVGVATSTLEARQPIYWNIGDPPDGSITTLVASAQYAHENYARRGELFTWWDPQDQWSTTSTSYVDVFPVEPAIQTRLISQSQTLGSIKARVCARCTGGTGQVRITLTNGSTYTWDVDNSVNDWLDEVTLQAETDEPERWGVDGGIRGGTRDTIKLEARAPSGETMHVVGLSVCETPTSGGESESANVLMLDGTPVTYGGEYIFVPVPYP